MKKLFVVTVVATLLFATSAMAFDTSSIETRCFNVYPYCDQIYIDWTIGNQIWGYNDNCGYIDPSLVGGWIYSVQDWVMFIDWPGASQGYFEYGVMKGSARNATLYRWDSDGNPASPISVSLEPCAQAVEGGGGSAGVLE